MKLKYVQSTVTVQWLQKVFRPLQSLHTLLCYRVHFKWIQLTFLPINLASITHNDQVKTCF